MEIFGLEKLSLVDYDGFVAATVFTARCNFKCGFCHNAALVLDYNSLSQISEEEVLAYLTKRKGVLEGLCVTGGEPTLNKDLPEFIKNFSVVVQNAYDAVMADYGGLFWVYGYQANTYHTGDTVLGLTFSPTYTMTQSEQEVKQAEIDAVVEQWLSNLPADASDYDKAKYVYETLITNCDYDVNATDNQNIISVFLNGSTVCQGYADATSYLLNQLGIQSTIIVGTANNESHAWNMVRLDDQYYYIDTTWGNSTYSDSEDAKFINYAYLNVTSEEISQNHTVEMNIELPECTATEDNYYHKEGLYFESGQLSEIGTLIQNAYNRGDETVSMKFNSAATYDSVYNYFIAQSNIAKYCYGIQDIRYIEIQSANVLVLVFG